LALCFSGQSSWLAGIDRSLIQTAPALDYALRDCDRIVRDALGWSLESFLFSSPDVDGSTECTVRMQVAAVAAEYSLACLWKSWGVEPAVLLGSDVGEVTAACLAGVFDLESALRLAAARADVLSGNSQQRIKEYESLCRDLHYTEPQMRIVSAAAGDPNSAAMTTAQYWCDHLFQTTATELGSRTATEEGCRVFLQIGGDSGAPSNGSMPGTPAPESASHDGADWLSCPGPDALDWHTVLQTLAKLYTCGVSVDWQSLDRPFRRRKVSLPVYPFQRARYWLDMGERESHTRPTPEPDASALGSLLGSPSLLAQNDFESTPVERAHGARGLDRASNECAPKRGDLPLWAGGPAALEEVAAGPRSAEPPSRRAPGPGEVEIRVLARDGTNGLVHETHDRPQRDSSSAHGCAGEIVCVGEDSVGFRPGDAVIAIVVDDPSAYVTVPVEYVTAKPEPLTFDQAASLSVGFLTASVALEEVTRIRPGDRLLVHGADETSGLAAIRIAQRLGAQVFATADARRLDALESLGVNRVWDSESPYLVEEIRSVTDGQGVDAVLGLRAWGSGIATCAILAPQGRFLEVRPADAEEHPDQSPSRPDTWHMFIDVNEVIRHEPSLVQHVLSRLCAEYSRAPLLAGLPCASDAPSNRDAEFYQQWVCAAREDRLPRLTDYLQEEIAQLLGLDPSQVNTNEPLNYLGVDSLMALDLRNRVKAIVGLYIPMTTFIEGASVTSLAEQLARQLTEPTSPPQRISDAASDGDWIEGEV